MTFSVTRLDRAALILILVIGAWLRFQHTGAIEYNIDQVYPVWQAIQTLDEGKFPLVGQGTSVLFANPPLTGYFFVPVIALVRQPVAAYVLTLILNTFAIWLAYRGLRWLIGTRPALVGAALVAVNPWIIEDSRRTWVQSLAPFFVCLVFWALAPLLTGQTRHPQRRTLIALVGLALFAHTYLLAYALVAPVGLLILLFWRRIPRRALGIGAAVFAALMVLYGIGLARQWEDTRSRAGEFSSGNARLTSEAYSHALGLVTGRSYAAVRGVDAPAGDAELRRTLSDGLHVVWSLAVLAGIIRAAQAISGRTSPLNPCSAGKGLSLQEVRFDPQAAAILLIWFWLPVLMMSYVSRVVHPFYLLLTVPAGHGLAAWGIAPLLRRRGWIGLAAGLVIVTGAVNGLNAVRFAQNSLAHPGEDLPETLPLADATALGTRLRAALAPGMAVFSPMDEWTPVTLAGRALRAEQVSAFDRALLVPPGGGLVATMQRAPDLQMVPPLFARTAGSTLVLADDTRIALWTLHPADLPVAHPTDIPSDIGVTFAGWTLNGDLAPGQPVTLDTFWRVTALHPERGIWTFAPFAHLYGGDTRLLIADGTVIPPLTWQVGDWMAHRLTFEVPPDAVGPLSVQIGQYDGVRGVSAIFQVPTGDEIVYTPNISLDGD